MKALNIFGDDRKIPKITINTKVCVKNLNNDETRAWNKAFGYIMRKGHSKLEFISVDSIRELSLDKIKLADLKEVLSNTDYDILKTVEGIFDNKISTDLKAFILAMLKVPVTFILNKQ